MTELRDTALRGLHEALGARLVGFAGYAMPLHYPAGILKEHLATRAGAGLFDVSHMGQIRIAPRAGGMAAAAAALETVLPIDVVDLPPGRQRYGFLTDDGGGILDDAMLANLGDQYLLVANAANKAAVLAHLSDRIGDRTKVTLDDAALIAVQGPAAEAALAPLQPAVATMAFMDVARLDLGDVPAVIARSGYTGEDGFEISCPAEAAEGLARRLLAAPGVVPVGLGARDTLRLEAGLCLHGADIGPDISPVEASLAWAIPAVRRPGGARAGGYPGAARIERDLIAGPARRRVGLLPEGRAPMRAGTPLFAAPEADRPVGHITSGGFGPSLGAPCAMGYVDAAHAAPGTLLVAELRGKRLPVKVTRMPFVARGYKRSGQGKSA